MSAPAVSKEMYVYQIYVISAYVQRELHDELYIEQTEMFIDHDNKDRNCKLLRPLYELKKSGHEWYTK